MTYRFLLLALIGFTVFTSCRKKDKDKQTVENTGTIENGTFTPEEEAPYIPLKVGNEWVYNEEENYLLSIDNTTEINGKENFVETINSNGVKANTNIRFEDGAYYRTQEIYGADAQFNLTSEIMEIKILDVNANAGTSWSYQVTVGSVITNYIYTLQAKNVPFEYNDITYKDAIQVSLVINSNLDFGGINLEDIFNQNLKTQQGYTKIAEQNYVYVKGIGLMEQTSSSLFDSFFEIPNLLNLKLKSYSVDY